MALAMGWEEWSRHDGVGLAELVRTGQLTPAELAQQVAAGIAKTGPSGTRKSR